MKKLILSSLAMASLAFAAHAVTYMRVHTSNGKVVKYDVEHVTKVYYEETSETPSQVVDSVTVSGKAGIYTYVDLGLESGTKWATYNVGATKPTEYGDYFAWGETKPKVDYSWETYKWCNNGNWNRMTKYCTKTSYGTVDNMKVLGTEDDAATANWGRAWRMPTREEIEELRDGCEWEWVEDFSGSGVNGQLGISKKNEATIFLPAAGDRSDSDLDYVGLSVGYFGGYWSSSLDYEDCPRNAYYLVFGSGGFNCIGYHRIYGRSVRAVLR